jgi:hypothetical protein
MIDDPAHVVLIEAGSFGSGRKIRAFNDHMHSVHYTPAAD